METGSKPDYSFKQHKGYGTKDAWLTFEASRPTHTSTHILAVPEVAALLPLQPLPRSGGQTKEFDTPGEANSELGCGSESGASPASRHASTYAA
jgi:hypothetical protein